MSYTFPAGQELRQRWREEMNAYNDYLGEKTEATVLQWLAGKTMTHYDLIPAYALYDYHTYLKMDHGSNPAMMMVLNMAAKQDLEAMKAALDRIATRV